MAKKKGGVEKSIVPIISDDRKGNYVIKVPRVYGYLVRNRFPSSETYDEKRFVVEQTPANSSKIAKAWPRAVWLCRKMTKQNKQTFVDKMAVQVQRSKDKRVQTEAVVLEHPRWEDMFPFQPAAVEFMSERMGAICGDDMGLGKTIEAIITADVVSGDGRVLIVAPNTILENWSDEILDWQADPDKPVFVITGTPHQRREILSEIEEEESCWVIINWEALRLHTNANAEEEEKHNEDNRLGLIEFDSVIADEAHRAKNRNAQQTKALKRIRTKRRYALTGTPVMNQPDELWSILNWLDRKTFSSYWRFYETYVEYDEGYFGREVIGPKNVEQLAALLDSWMIRRLKKDVYKDLPDKVYKEITVDLTPAQKKAYRQMKERLLTQIADGTIVTATAAIAAMIRLQQICISLALLSSETDSSKFAVVRDILADAGDGKVVIFSRFSKACEALARELTAKNGQSIVYLTGDLTALIEPSTKANPQPQVTKVTRGEAVKVFQNDDRYKVYIGTTQAGGVGITLTAADTVIFLDKMWTPADQRQAEDRLHRIGQKKSVQVVSILVKDSIEEYVEETLARKEKMVKAIMRRAEERGEGISKEDANEKAEKTDLVSRRLRRAEKKGASALADVVSEMIGGSE